MKFHAVKRRTFFGDLEGIIDASHDALFHGSANRGGQKPTSRNARVAYEVDRPLALHKNVYQIADVFAPEFTLVVSAKVRHLLRSISGLQFREVKFVTLFEVPFREGDFSHYASIGDYFAFERFIDRQVDKPALHKNVGEFFEVIAAPVRDFKQNYELQEVEVRFGPRHSDSRKLLVSHQLLNDVPIYAVGGHVVTEPVFTVLEPFVNWTYFAHGEGTI